MAQLSRYAFRCTTARAPSASRGLNHLHLIQLSPPGRWEFWMYSLGRGFNSINAPRGWGLVHTLWLSPCRQVRRALHKAGPCTPQHTGGGDEDADKNLRPRFGVL